MSTSWRDGVALLAGVLGVTAVTGYPFWSSFCPIGILSRNLILLGKHQTLSWSLGIAAAYPFVLLFFVDWTRVCPVGNVGGVANMYTSTETVRYAPDECIGCNRCVTVCPRGNDVRGPRTEQDACINCFRCVEECPTDALDVDLLDLHRRRSTDDEKR